MKIIPVIKSGVLLLIFSNTIAQYQSEKMVTADDSTLHYTISFESHNKDTLKTIVVIDTLSTFLNTNTFTLSGASHPYKFSFIDDHVACWVFYDRSDQKNETGYIKYAIDVMPKHPDLMKIINHAHVQVNNKTDSLVSLTGNFEDHKNDRSSKLNHLGMSMTYNELNDELDIMPSDSIHLEQYTVEIYNRDGVVEFIGKLNYDEHIFINTSFLESGEHFVSIQDYEHHESLLRFVSK